MLKNIGLCWRIRWFVVLVGLILVDCTYMRQTGEYDLIIRSAKIVDGTGNPWFCADVGIRGDLIVKIGTLSDQAAHKVIDAKGLHLAPGFVDTHSHVDMMIESDPAVKNYLLQGVTTAVGGNCGASRYPFGEFFEGLRKTGIGINLALLIGHNTIREQVMGLSAEVPTERQIKKMQMLVKQEMQAGGIGLSTGLAYVPGRFSTTEEIIELAKMVKPFGGLYATHLRNQGEKISEAIQEAISIGEQAGIPVEISHIKLATELVWGSYQLIFEPIEQARSRGIEVYMDQYPYTATSSGFASSFPGWAVAGGNDALLERLKDPENYKKIKQAIIQKRLTSQKDIDKLKTIFVAHNPNHPTYEGKNLTQILEILGREATVDNAADLIIEMQKTDDPRGIFFQMTEQDVQVLMKKPYNMIGSDGKVEVPGVEMPHPRAYGTFPRVLSRYVRELGILSLEDAIRKMTSLPAQAMGFRDRGVIKPGHFADLVVFDMQAIKDTASYENPHQYPQGIRWVIVNGKIAAQDGKLKISNAGRLLRR